MKIDLTYFNVACRQCVLSAPGILHKCKSVRSHVLNFENTSTYRTKIQMKKKSKWNENKKMNKNDDKKKN